MTVCQAITTIDEDKSNKTDSGCRNLWWLLDGARKVIMIDGVMSLNCDLRDGSAEHHLRFLRTVSQCYSQGPLYL